MNIHIRLATMDDYDAICCLYRQLDDHHVDLLPAVFQPTPNPPRPRDRFERFIQAADADYILAAVNGKIAGFLHLEARAHPPYPMFRPHTFAAVHNMVVDVDYQGAGIGKRLIDAAKSWARWRGLNALQTSVWSANTGAKNFYISQGFQPKTEKLEVSLLDEGE